MRTFTAVITILLALSAGATVHAEDKVTLCHAAGQEWTTHYETITVGYPAAYGPAGHFEENGTPRAGHEQDYLGPCSQPEPPTTTVITTTVPDTTPSSSSPTTPPTDPESTSTTPATTQPVDEPTTTSFVPTSTTNFVAVDLPPIPTQPSTSSSENATTTVAAPSTKKSLPETGNNLTLALIAAGLVGLGGGATLLARRK